MKPLNRFVFTPDDVIITEPGEPLPVDEHDEDSQRGPVADLPSPAPDHQA